MYLALIILPEWDQALLPPQIKIHLTIPIFTLLLWQINANYLLSSLRKHLFCTLIP